MRKSFLTYLSETIDQYKQKRHTQTHQDTSSRRGRARGVILWLLPNGGTLLLIALLLLTQNVWAGVSLRSLAAANAASTQVIAYQGRLTDTSENPLTGTLDMRFRLYSAASGGLSLWEEAWLDASAVEVNGGLFHVMLGSLTPIPQSVISGNSSLFLGMTVNTDAEMTPRVQLGSVPFAVQALTVPDGSITTGKIADGAVTQSKAPSLAQAIFLGNEAVRMEAFSVTCSGNGGCDYTFTVGFVETPMILKSAFDDLAIANYGPNPTNNQAMHAVSQANSTHMLVAIGR